MRAAEAAALEVIAAEYEMDVLYTGAGLSNAGITAIKSDFAAGAFQGPGNTLREISFEVPRGLLPQEPDNRDLIVEVESGVRWEVIDIVRRDDVAAWRLTVEEAQ